MSRPSHVGIPLNEMADTAAAAGRRLPQVTVNPNRSRTQLKNDFKSNARLERTRSLTAQTPNSASLTWRRVATGNRTLTSTPAIPRSAEVAIYRLRLGYRCKWEIQETREAECPECDHPTTQPLAHYLAQCPITAPFFGETTDLMNADHPETAAVRVRHACQK